MTAPVPVTDKRLAQLLTFYDEHDQCLHVIDEDAADYANALRELLAARVTIAELRETQSTLGEWIEQRGHHGWCELRNPYTTGECDCGYASALTSTAKGEERG